MLTCPANIYECCLNKKFKKYNCGSCDIKMSQLWSSDYNLEFMSISFSVEARLHHSPQPEQTEQHPCASSCFQTKWTRDRDVAF